MKSKRQSGKDRTQFFVERYSLNSPLEEQSLLFAVGIEEGRHRGIRAAVTQLLEKRFGHLPSSVTTQIDFMSYPEAEEIISNIFDAKSLKDLFPDLKSSPKSISRTMKK